MSRCKSIARARARNTLDIGLDVPCIEYCVMSVERVCAMESASVHSLSDGGRKRRMTSCCVCVCVRERSLADRFMLPLSDVGLAVTHTRFLTRSICAACVRCTIPVQQYYTKKEGSSINNSRSRVPNTSRAFRRRTGGGWPGLNGASETTGRCRCRCVRNRAALARTHTHTNNTKRNPIKCN